MPYFYKTRIGLTVEGWVTPELIDKLLQYYKFYRMKAGRRELEELLSTGSRCSYADFVSANFDLYGDFWGKPLVGDKTPDYIRDLPTLHALWPGAKFVHLIRDGRDTCLSAINWKRKAAKFSRMFPTWGEHPVGTAAVWWEWNVRQGLQAGRALSPDLYYELRYEALVAQPSVECAKVCAFLGVGYDDSMLHFHEGRPRPGTVLTPSYPGSLSQPGCVIGGRKCPPKTWNVSRRSQATFSSNWATPALGPVLDLNCHNKPTESENR